MKTTERRIAALEAKTAPDDFLQIEMVAWSPDLPPAPIDPHGRVTRIVLVGIEPIATEGGTLQ